MSTRSDTRPSSARRAPALLLLTAGALAASAAAPSVHAAAPASAPSPPASGQPASTLPKLATFGSGLGSGSTIGPDGALYVTDGNAGSVLRIDPGTGEVTTVGDGLPPQVLGIGGAMDVVFVDDIAYVLVTMVGGDIVDGDPIGDDVVGIYRLDVDGTFMVFADIGSWSVEHAPATDFFITTGVQYALEASADGLLVTDGHHNRVLRVGDDGAVSELIALENVVPTGIEVAGDTTYVAITGPLPHLPEDGRVVEFGADSSAVTDVASGASMVVDVEMAGETLYALSQGEWDGVQEGSPALPNTGRLVTIGADGSLTPVTDAAGDEIVLDRPTSLEFADGTASIVTVAGDVFTIDITSATPYDTTS